jgi:hypothetical protein
LCTICQVGRTARELIEGNVLTWKQARECSVEISPDRHLVESFVLPDGRSVLHVGEIRRGFG